MIELQKELILTRLMHFKVGKMILLYIAQLELKFQLVSKKKRKGLM